MKILIVNTLYSPIQIGGAELSVQELAEGFYTLGHQVTVAALSKETKVYEVNHIKVISRKLKNAYWPYDKEKKTTLQKFTWHYNDRHNRRYDKVFDELLRDEMPDVLLTNNLTGFSARIWEIGKRHEIPIVHTLRDYYLMCPRTTRFKHQKNCTQRCSSCIWLTRQKKLASGLVDHVVGISQFILENHIQEGYFENVNQSVIYNGFDVSKFKNQKQKKGALVFGFLGQVQESKGIGLLLKSLMSLENFDWQLKIAGKVSKVDGDVLLKTDDDPRITFLGHTDPQDFFNQINVLVVPSLWHEPFGRVILEAMLHKVPVLASKVGGIPELLKGNEEFLFEPNQHDLQDKLENILSDSRIIQTFKFDRAFIESFAIEKTIQNYINIFESVQKDQS